jgi:DNA ligase-1
VAYDPFVIFGVKQVPTTTDITGAENPWVDFEKLLGSLANRELTGNAARDALDTMSQRFDSDEWNGFCANVIKKDLRCGISDKTINKVVGNTKYKIPVFGCQLATSCEDRPEMSGVKRLEPKLDGVRVLLRVDSVVSSYSRNGKVFENFGHIEQAIIGVCKKLISVGGKSLASGFLLDGEVTGNSFQELMKQARRKRDAQATDSVFHVFDIIPLEDFDRGHWNAQLSKRIAILEKLRPIFETTTCIKLLPSIQVDLDTAAGRDQLDRYAGDQVRVGYEGIMIKSLDAPYECKRNTFWLKWKPTITVDLEITHVEAGTGRNAGRLGALVCNGVDSGKTISVNVGSGFSDDQRISFYDDRDNLIGQVVEVLADAVTQNQDGSYSLRFPRFVRFRGFEVGEKV